MITSAPARPATRRRAPTPPRRRLHRLDMTVSPYVYIAPFFIIFGIFGLFPMGFTAWVALHDWSLLEDEHPYVGLANFTALLTDGYFWNAAFNTLSIGILSTVPQLLLALLLAHLLNRRVRARTFFQMTMLIPNVTSVVAVVVIFSQLFGRDFGLINWVLEELGAGRIDWQAGTASSHVAISVMIIWRWTGYNALIYLAAMQAVPRVLYEAATIDGASGLRQLRSITIPMIRPTIVFTVIVSTIGALQILAEPLLFGNGKVQGGADRQFQTLALYLYEQGFANFDFGFASAAAWVMCVFAIVAAGINYVIVRGRS